MALSRIPIVSRVDFKSTSEDGLTEGEGSDDAKGSEEVSLLDEWIVSKENEDPEESTVSDAGTGLDEGTVSEA